MHTQPEARHPIRTETYRVRSYEVDADGRLSVPALFNLLQDAASNHAEALGVSIRHLRSENLTWVLSRLHLSIDAWPRWGDTLQVQTWPSGVDRLFALRDFRLLDGGGTPVGAAVSAWLVIRTATRRPVRISPFIERLHPLDAGHVLPPTFAKLPPLAPPAHEKRFRVRYRDLDINRHVNNVSYIEWAVEGVPRDRMSRAVLTGLEISYMAEAFLDDGILACCRAETRDQSRFLHSIRQEASGRELARARTTWKPVADAFPLAPQAGSL